MYTCIYISVYIYIYKPNIKKKPMQLLKRGNRVWKDTSAVKSTFNIAKDPGLVPSPHN